MPAYNLCEEIKEVPIYKIVLYTPGGGQKPVTKRFVFVGKDESLFKMLNKKSGLTEANKKQLAKRFPKYENKFHTKDSPVYINESIYHDDTILTIKAKIATYLNDELYEKTSSPNDLYCWGTRAVPNQKVLAETFTSNLYHNRILVGKDELKMAYLYLTGHPLNTGADNGQATLSRSDAFDLIMRQKSKRSAIAIEPLGFKLLSDNMEAIFPVNPVLNMDVLETFDIDTDEVEPLQQHAMTIESFGIEDHTIHVIERSVLMNNISQEKHELLSKVYFPYVDKPLPEIKPNKLKKDDEVVEDVQGYRDTGNSVEFEVKCVPNYVHMRVNEGSSDKLGLVDMFGAFVPNEDMPFVKLIRQSGTSYKAFKPYMKEHRQGISIISKNDLNQWTKPDMARLMKNKQDILVFKIYLGKIMDEHRFSSVMLFENGMYDVKFNFKIHDNVSLDDVSNMMKTINMHMAKISTEAFAPLPIDTAVWAKRSNYQDTKIYKMMATGTINSNKKPKNIAQLQAAFQKLYPYFAVISNDNDILHMLYKRIDNFTKQDNVMQHMNRYSMLAKNDLIKNIMDVFGLSLQVAEDYYGRWAVTNKIENMRMGARLYYKPRSMHIVSVKIKPSKLGYSFFIGGITDTIQHKRILRAFKYALSVDNPKKSKAVYKDKDEQDVAEQIHNEEVAAKNLDVDNEDEEDVGEEDNNFLDLFMQDEDAPQNIEGNFFKENNDQELGDLGAEEVTANVKNMKEGMECPAHPKSKKQKGGAKDEDSWQHKYLLEKLRDADRRLFDYKPADPMKRYAKVCQKTSKRQPIAMSKTELEYNDKCFPSAITSSGKFGSTDELKAKNFYVCPRVWCPKSRVALTFEQFEKDFGSKCPFPEVEETPLVFDNNYFPRDKPRGIEKMRQTYHPEHFDMPCCFKTKVETREDKDSGVKEKDPNKAKDGANDKYIKGYIFPLEDGRFGLLPENLGNFFGNKFCGGTDGKEGLVRPKTDCYVRQGMHLNTQSFFATLVALLDNPNIKIVEDIPVAIEKHLCMDLYMSLNDGVLCRKFINDYTSIDDGKTFAKFKAWFCNKKQKPYIVRCNLTSVHGVVVKANTFEEVRLYEDEIKREFILWTSFVSFIDYIKDTKLSKTHDVLIDLANKELPWLNCHGYNIIVFDIDLEGTAYLACPLYKNAKAAFMKQKPIIMLAKQAQYYEPIIHIKHSQGGMSKTELHNYRDSEGIYRATKYYIKTCTPDKYDPSAQKILSFLESKGDPVTRQVINHDLHTIGYVTRGNMFFPLKKPAPIKHEHKSSIMFADTFYKHFKHNIDKNAIQAMFVAINEYLDQEYYTPEKILKLNGKAGIMLLEGKLVVPMVPMSELGTKGSVHLDDYIHDASIFIGMHGKDERSGLIEGMSNLEKLHASFHNEIVKIIDRVPGIKEQVQFLRHAHNPLPKNLKRQILKDALGPHLNRILYTRASDQMPSFFLDKLCSGVAKPDQCVGQCKWTVKSKSDNQGHCKLSIPKNLESHLHNKAIEKILNPSVPLTPVNVNEKLQNIETTLAFGDHDVINGNLTKMVGYLENPHVFDVDKTNMELDMARFEQIGFKDKDADMLPNETKQLPTFLRSAFKDIGLYSFGDYYDKNWVYDLMLKAHNYTHPEAKITREKLYDLVNNMLDNDIKTKNKTALDMLRANAFVAAEMAKPQQTTIAEIVEMDDYAPGEYELRVLGNIAKVNVVVVGRQSERNPDKIRCMAKNDSTYYIVLNHTKKEIDVFEPFMKDGKRFMMTLKDFGRIVIKDFGKSFPTIVREKCAVY